MTEKPSNSSHLGSRRGVGLVYVAAVFVLFAGSYLLAAEETADSGLALYRVFSLRHISAQKGKEYLAQTKLGTVSQLPGANTLLVTAPRRELIKASAILRVVDAKEPFVIKAIFPASLAQDLPSNEQIAAKVGDVSIGTFSDPPAAGLQARAIIDVHNDAVVAVAPASRLEKIVSAMNSLLANRQPLIAQATNGEQRATNNEQQHTNNEFFSKLLNSLAEAEKRVTERAREVSRPNEPNAAITVPEVKVPGKPTAGREPRPELTEQLREAEFAAIVKRLAALEAKLKAEPTPEAPKVVTVEIAEPNEIVEPNEIAEPNEVAEPNEAAGPVTKVRYEPEHIPDGNDVLKLDLPMGLTIIEFMDYMTMNLHLDYLYDPKKVVGNVNLKLHGKFAGDIRRKDLYPLLESVMQFNGFVMTRKGNLLIVVPKAEADIIDAPFVDPEREKLEHGDVIVMSVFKLKHINTATAKQLLTSMQLGLQIREVPEAKMLMVTGYAYRMPRIEEVLEVIDRPGEPKQFKSRQLKFTMAKTLAPKVKTLAEQLGTISVTVAAGAPSGPAVTRKRGESAAAFRARQAAARRSATRPTAARAPAAKPTVYLEADERTNRILMIGLEEQLAVVNKLIDSLDVEQQELRTLRYIEIQHVDAEEVKTKLSELGIIGGAATTRRTTPTGKAPGPAKPGVRAATAGRTAEALVEEPQVIIIESTNALLINATDEQHVQIAVIIAYVDREAEIASIPYVIYPLENQDPEELSGVLNQLIKETVAGKDAKGAKIERTEKRIEEDVIIISDPKTYSLIVYASKKNQQWIGSLIKQLDEYRPQVLLDVMLVEVTKNDEFNFDLNIISSFPDLVNTSGLTGYIAGEGVDAITSSGIMNKLSGGTDRFIDFQSDRGSGTGFYGDKHINVLLTAMQKKDYGRVLARPKLLVNDNEEGMIKSLETIHITRERITYRKGTPTGGAVEDIPITDVEFLPYEAGIQLDITPHISKGDQLRLTITMTRKDFRMTGDTSALAKPPDIVTSDITTVVTVPDGKTIILGGLERLSQSKGGTKVPLLGDIPVLGGLFRSTANTDKQSRLYVFVKAHILRPGEELTGESDIEVVSARNRATFERYEREMQEYEDWPGIKPKPMDPLQILEVD